MHKLSCCFVGCNKEAEFLVIDTKEARYEYTETYSCEKHLGALIGSVEPTKPTGPWLIYPLIYSSKEEV